MTEPVFDREALVRLADAVDPEFARDIADLYLTQIDALAAAVEEGLRTGDGEAGRRAAHSLKASSGQVGALGLAALCRRLELGEAIRLEDVTIELNRLVEATRNALEAEWDKPREG